MQQRLSAVRSGDHSFVPHTKNLAEARGRSDREIYMQLPVHVIVDRSQTICELSSVMGIVMPVVQILSWQHDLQNWLKSI